ncbi:hypothetical protein LNP74_20930 [Klebsiella pneumoniae subsp. pneumoniae]|nr:hypothetical protein [Klebsiella pneumoniae subsp. pneumoniae]
MPSTWRGAAASGASRKWLRRYYADEVGLIYVGPAPRHPLSVCRWRLYRVTNSWPYFCVSLTAQGKEPTPLIRLYRPPWPPDSAPERGLIEITTASQPAPTAISTACRPINEGNLAVQLQMISL